MKEVHGVVAKKDYTMLADNEVTVRITDADSGILIVLSTDSNHPALLSVEEARFLAKQLVDAAKRFEQRKNK